MTLIQLSEVIANESMDDSILELVICNAITGEERKLEARKTCTIRDFQVKLHRVFAIPPFEQVLLHEDGDAVLGDGRFDDTRPIGSMPKLCSDVPLMIVRKTDMRPQTEKNCAFVQALGEGKIDEAMNILDSSGVPVDPNCIGCFVDERQGFLSSAASRREFADIRSAKMPALCMAVMARCRWSPQGSVTGERADETSVVRIVERLLAMGASLDETKAEVLTCGSWPDELVNKTALYLAVQTRSVPLVRVLLDAGADPTKGCCMNQFRPKVVPCEHALRGVEHDSVTEELLSLLRRQEYEVKISCEDQPSSGLGIKVSRRDTHWGFIDEIGPHGLLAKWNQQQPDDKKLKVGDKIVAVCGYRSGIDCSPGTGFFVDEQTRDASACFLDTLLSKPENNMTLMLHRTNCSF